MTQDEIIRMAREAGLNVHPRKNQIRVGADVFLGDDSTPAVIRFAELVEEAERNTCIADCMEQHKLSIEAAEKAKKVRDQDNYFNTATGAKFAAIRIQQRGNVK
jgi:hypothetical protein